MPDGWIEMLRLERPGGSRTPAGHRLAGVHKRDAPSSSRRGPHAPRGLRKPSLDDAHLETRHSGEVDQESGRIIATRAPQKGLVRRAQLGTESRHPSRGVA
ncbi:MAG: Exonuclease SbcC [Nitrospira sp.]|nr:MAG: Exonuclease SbcC [Nitrospira sp.]